MENEYLNHIKEDPVLYEAVASCLPALEKMTPNQVEKLVFFLKSMHTYYPKSENHTEFYDEFAEKLERIKFSEEQILLQRRMSISAIKAMLICVCSGLLLAISLALFLSDERGYGTLLLFLSVACVFYADAKFWKQSVLISKEQDRRYFLASIREAKACNELDWAGLFAFNQASKANPRSAEEIKSHEYKVGEITAKLRAALYNDECFQYSQAGFDVVENVRSKIE